MKIRFSFIFTIPVLLFLGLLSCTRNNETLPPTDIPENVGSESVQAEKTPVVFSLPTSTPMGRSLTEEDKYTFEQNRRLGRGINILLTQDEEMAPEEGILPDKKYFQAIKDAGFNSINLLIGWHAAAQAEAPYEIDPAMFLWLDPILEELDRLDLAVVLYFAGYQEFEETPRVHTERFLAIWEQVADHYKNYPDSLYFGIYFFPSQTLAATWNDIANQAISTIRKTNPERTLVLGESFFSASTLRGFSLPENDRNLILYIAYFNPFRFTFQGMFDEQGRNADRRGNDEDDDVNEPTRRPFPTMEPVSWTGTESEIKEITDYMDEAQNYTRMFARPVTLLAFGCSNRVDQESRTKWIRAVVQAVEARDMSWSYWAFVLGPMSAYDWEDDRWDYTVLNALFNK